MRNRNIEWVAALVIGFVVSGPGQAQQIVNQITNGNFETGVTAPWGTFGTITIEVVTTCAGATVSGGPIEGRYCLHVTVPAAGTNYWDLGLSPHGMVFQKGKKYTLSAFLKCKKGTLQLDFKPQLGQDPWTGYGQKTVTMTDQWAEYTTTTPVFTEDVTPPNIAFHAGFAAAEFWVDDVKWYEGDYVPTVVKTKTGASSPTPDDRVTDVPHDVTLGWKAGPYAATHNVYLGTTFADANTADVSKAVSQGQTGLTYKVSTPLEYGQTYYWRVDEVNAPPSTAVAQGDVWSFTVEPYAYPITNITATASSTQPGMEPQNTVNGSGLDASGLHGTDASTMWLSTGAPLPNWIQYQFDSTYKLYQLKVWNSNQMVESFLGFGAKDVKVEYSTDGTTWTALDNVPQFARAPGMPGYAANTTVSLGGVMAQYVKLTIDSTWGGMAVTGLSEVQFSCVPVVARAPQPATNATAVSLGATLDWRPGRDAASQEMYLDTDKAAVTNGTATAQTLTDHGFTPATLSFGTTYYWKVDEIGAATYPGPVWKFTTQEYAVVDDFESYTDKTGQTIYDTWFDGLGGNGTGSQVGYLQAPFAEQTMVHGGNQSMPFGYNNVKAPYYSEATRTFDTPQDWTANGADTLTLYFQGFPTGFVDKGNNAYTVAGTGTDIWNNVDQFRFVYKTLSGNGSITARVDDLSRSDAWAKAGVMIRESLDAGSRHASIVVTPDNSCSQQYRSTTGGAAASTDWTGAAVKAPYWVRVTRTGNTFKTETSPDGKTWTALGADQTITMVANVYIGLCVTSHTASAYTVANFSNVSTTGTGAWQNLSIGVTQYSNDVAPLYVTVEDKAGKKKTVVNPDASAVTKSTWTQWRMALRDLPGVNVAAVKKLTIGVGDTISPKPGAAGMLFLDDILYGKPILPVGLAAK